MGLLKEIARLKVADRISLVFSAIALVFSTVGLYYQVFYVANDVIASWNMSIVGPDPLAIETLVDAVFINSGNRDALIMSCRPLVMERNSGQHQWTSLDRTMGHSPLETERLPRVIKPGAIEVVHCRRGAFSVPELFDSPSAYEAPERKDSRLRKIHLGVLVDAFDSTGKQWRPTYHLWTLYINKETMERGEGEPSIIRLFSGKQDAREKDWSKLRPVP